MFVAMFLTSSASSVSMNGAPVTKHLLERIVIPAASIRQQSAIDANIQCARRAAAPTPTEMLRGTMGANDNLSDVNTRKVGRSPCTLSRSTAYRWQPGKISHVDRHRGVFLRPVDTIRILVKTSQVWTVHALSSDADEESTAPHPAKTSDADPMASSAAQSTSEDSHSISDFRSMISNSSKQNTNYSDATTGTNATSIFDSDGDGDSLGHFFEIVETSIQKDADLEISRAQVAQAQRLLSLQGIQYQRLQQKYEIQLAQRQRDFDKVNEAHRRVQGSVARSIKLEKEQNATAKMHSREVSRLKSNQRAAMSVIESVHQTELERKNDKIDELREQLRKERQDSAQANNASQDEITHTVAAFSSELVQKDRKIQGLEAANKVKDNAIQKAEAAKDEMQVELRKEVKATEILRTAWHAQEDSLQHNACQMDLDFKDTLEQQKLTIVRLTNDNRRLELEKTALSMTALQHRENGFSCLRDTFLECEHMRKELDTMLQTNGMLEEKIENVLEAMQQERDHWEKNYDLEKVAQAQAGRLHFDLISEQEKVAQRNERIRDLIADLGAAHAPSNSVSHRLTAFMKAVSDNDELRSRITSMEQENAEIRKEANNHDVEVLRLTMENHVQAAELHKARADHCILLQAAEACGQEMQYLRAAVRGDEGVMSSEQRQGLVAYLESLTREKQELLYKVKVLTEERDDLRQNKESIEAGAQHEIDKVKSELRYYHTAYWDFAVNKVEKLQAELDFKNGRVYSLENQRPERNPRVADRAALRTACEYEAMESINPDQLPPEYHGPGFRPGRITAVMDALRVLRPTGWKAVDDLEKAWLQPLYKPVLEKDAAAHLDAHQQQVSEQAVAFVQSHAVQQHMLMVKPVLSTRTQLTIEAPHVPAYESRFARYGNMTREKWNELDADNKLDFVEMFLPAGQRQ